MIKVETTYYAMLFSLFALVAACTQSEVVTTFDPEAGKLTYDKTDTIADQIPITFNVYAGEQATTRAAVETEADLGRDGFSVFAYRTGTHDYDATAGTGSKPNFMYNQKIVGVYDGEDHLIGWTYTPMKYWPNQEGEKISFFAYGTHVPVEPQPYITQSGDIATRYEKYDESEPVYGNNSYKTGLTSGIVAISMSDYGGNPFLIYDLNASQGVVEMTEMYDLLVGAGTTNQTKQTIDGNISFTFKHALAAFGFGVRGVFNSTTTANANTINENSYIRIEEILIVVSLPQKGVYNIGANAWANDYAAGAPVETVFRFNAEKIAENLRYPDYYVYKKAVKDGELVDVVDDVKTAEKVSELNAQGKLLNYGVGRYKNGNEDLIGTPIPNNDNVYYYQKVGQIGDQQNLFYFIPQDNAGSVTFDFTITYHTLTADTRMLYGLGDVKNVVHKTVNVDFPGVNPETGINDAVGKRYMFNLQLGMSNVKINGVTEFGGYWTDKSNEDGTPYSEPFYYRVPKEQ